MAGNVYGSNVFGRVSDSLQIALNDENGLAVLAKCTGAPPTPAGVFQHGCLMLQLDTGTGNPALFQNTGSVAVPAWTLLASAGGTSALTDGQIFVGNASNVATDVAMSGDISINNAGVTAIAAGAIVNADINAAAAIDFSKLAALTSANILVGSAGNVATSVAMSGDVAINNTGATTIQNDAITTAKILDGQVTAAKLSVTATLQAVNITQASSTIRLYFSGGAGTFAKAETVTGGTSGSTAMVNSVQSGYLVVTAPSGDFQAGETITGGVSGATGVVGGTGDGCLINNWAIGASFTGSNSVVTAVSTNTGQGLTQVATAPGNGLGNNSFLYLNGSQSINTLRANGWTSITAAGLSSGVSLA